MFIQLLFYILLVIQNSKAEEKDCILIFPEKSSECKLSENAKRQYLIINIVVLRELIHLESVLIYVNQKQKLNIML